MGKNLLFIIFIFSAQIALCQDLSKIKQIDSLLLVQVKENDSTSIIKTHKTYLQDSILTSRSSYLFNPETKQLLFIKIYRKSGYATSNFHSVEHIHLFYLNNKLAKAVAYFTQHGIDYFYENDKFIFSSSSREFLNHEFYLQLSKNHMEFFKKNYLNTN